jgi:preprotein translocase subunit SecE
MSTELIVGLAVAAVLIGLVVYFKVFSRIGGWWTKARAFLKETRSELAKVTFPSRQDVIATTIVVIIASFIFSIFLTFSDIVINKVYSFVFGIFGT